ncbi:hypothetical protein D1007_04577 [Hordeum vulgare]|nr:hypothetical protein D1007_04577 [Hordeum vulgare]
MDTGGGSRRSNPPRTASSKRPSSNPCEGSNAPKRSFEKPAPKKPSVNWNTMQLAEFQHRRKLNPYANNREDFPGGELFWNRDQFLIYEDVLRSKKNLYFLVQWIDLEHVRKDMSYFGEAIAMVEQLQITNLISFHQDFDISIVAHFFATVHFHPDEARTMTWMTNGMQLTATWKYFMDLLQVRDEGLTTAVGLRRHAKPQAARKEKLLPYLSMKQTPTGEYYQFYPIIINL